MDHSITLDTDRILPTSHFIWNENGNDPVPMYLHFYNGDIGIGILIDSRYNDAQKWWYLKVKKNLLPKQGLIYIDGKDVIL